MICYFYKVLFPQLSRRASRTPPFVAPYTQQRKREHISSPLKFSSDTFTSSSLFFIFFLFSTAGTRVTGSFSHRMFSSWHWKKERRWRWKSVRVIVYVNWTCTNVIRMALNEIFMCRGLDASALEVAGRGTEGGERWYDDGADMACMSHIYTHQKYGALKIGLSFSYLFRRYLLSARSFFMLYAHLILALTFHSHILWFSVCVCWNSIFRLINMQFMLVFRVLFSIVSQSQSVCSVACRSHLTFIRTTTKIAR